MIVQFDVWTDELNYSINAPIKTDYLQLNEATIAV